MLAADGMTSLRRPEMVSCVHPTLRAGSIPSLSLSPNQEAQGISSGLRAGRTRGGILTV